MKNGKCPDCGADSFYAKDPEDQYNISRFTLDGKAVKYLEEDEDTEPVSIIDETEIYCERCAWHDKLRTLNT